MYHELTRMGSSAAAKASATKASATKASRRPAKHTRPRYDPWDSERVRALRRHLGYTQQQLSEELGTRQQTVSEWETGMYQPRGASAKLLSLIAEQAGFHYGVEQASRE